MDAEPRLIQTLDTVREREQLTTEELARRMGRHREAVSRLFNAAHPNPTLDTFSSLLKALGVTAEIHLHRAREGEPLITVRVDDVA
jgi:transcriptional regulator with XRE-family HTH domain